MEVIPLLKASPLFCAGLCHISEAVKAACPQLQCGDSSGVMKQCWCSPFLKTQRDAVGCASVGAYTDTVWGFSGQMQKKIPHALLRSFLTSSPASALNSWLYELGLMTCYLILLQIKYWQPRSVALHWHLDKCLWLDVWNVRVAVFLNVILEMENKESCKEDCGEQGISVDVATLC